MSLKQTALINEHRALKGRMVDFGGWELPIQYSGVIDEHVSCRSAAGLFDVSHMGEITVQGKQATSFLNYLVTNDVSPLSPNQAQYTAMCNPNGGIVDDLVIYKNSLEDYLLVVNASNTEKDFQHISKVAENFDVHVENQSHLWTQIALQGPLAETILQKITDVSLSEIKTYWFTTGKLLSTQNAIIARTGYTGEDGFELYVPWIDGPQLWNALIEEGTPLGLKPCGLGARDTLRLEMKYPLYGNELTDQTNPLEVGLAWVTKLKKDSDFIGKNSCIELKEKGLTKKLVGFELVERGIPRTHYEIYDATGNTKIGEVTSGTQSPSLKKAIGIGWILKEHGEIGASLKIDIRGKKINAKVVKTPFYQKG